MRNKIVEKSQTYHILIHVLLGFICALSISKKFGSENLFLLLFSGFLGNTLPDVDHLIYYLTYGKDSEYSQIIKLFIKEKDFKEVKKFLRENHKYLTGLYSHTIISPIVSSALTYLFLNKNRIYMATFFLSITVHFLYDILEDLLFFKKLNPNWFMHFNRKNKNNQGIQLQYLEILKNKKEN